MAASLLLSEGHHHARKYPITMLMYEAQLARERNGARMADEALAMNTVIGAALGGKDGQGALKKLLQRLRNG